MLPNSTHSGASPDGYLPFFSPSIDIEISPFLLSRVTCTLWLYMSPTKLFAFFRDPRSLRPKISKEIKTYVRYAKIAIGIPNAQARLK